MKHQNGNDQNGHDQNESPLFTTFRDVPRTGVIYVMTEALAAGFRPADTSWTNFGQGQPEAGALPGAPPRCSSLEIDIDDLEYAPVAGIWELREAVADHYNRLYRRGMPSRYSAENVCISGGGRSALARLAASLGEINLGHFIPDYTAYEELLGLFRFFQSIPILLDPDRGYDFSLDELRREILGRGLSAILVSNPCNPTGKAMTGESLRGWVSLARRHDCTLILDEFYSHYLWTNTADERPTTCTAARYVEDVEVDPVVILDGLTKNWRYPGFRTSWTVGPKRIIEHVTSSGSFLDGGGARPLQRAVVPLLEDDTTLAEIRAIQSAFRPKRDLLLNRLTAMGIRVERPPEGTFYVWGSTRDLPDSIANGMDFFRVGLEHSVICVPGEFFDVNPGRRRAARPSRYRHHVRFSFGPPMAALEAGLDRIQTMVESA